MRSKWSVHVYKTKNLEVDLHLKVYFKFAKLCTFFHLSLQFFLSNTFNLTSFIYCVRQQLMIYYSFSSFPCLYPCYSVSMFPTKGPSSQEARKGCVFNTMGPVCVSYNSDKSPWRSLDRCLYWGVWDSKYLYYQEIET